MRDFFRTYVWNNIGLKLISLALAVGLWLALARDPVAEVAVEVPIVFRNIPENLGIGYETVPRAQILLRGPQRAVRDVEPSDVHAEVDLTGAEPGERLFSSSAVRVHKPPDLEVVEVSPDKFRITFSVVRKSSAASRETH